MIRNRSALVAAALMVAVLAGACSSSSATFPPAAGSVGGGGGGGGGGGTGAPAVNPNDPQTIVDHILGNGAQLVGGSQVVKSFHLKMALSGTIKASGLAQLDPTMASTVTSDIKLDGTAIEGDIDIANQAAHLSLNVPGLPMLGGTPITADMILVGQAVYVKTALLGPKYNVFDTSSLGGLTSGLTSGLPLPTPGASTLSNIGTSVTDLQQQLKDAGAKVTLVGTEKIGGKDAYHINISVPVDKLNSEIAAAAAAASAGPVQLTIDSASVDLWAYTDGYNLAQLEVKGAASVLGNIDFVVTVTNYDQPVTITAPDPSAVQTFNLGG